MCVEGMRGVIRSGCGLFVANGGVYGVFGLRCCGKDATGPIVRDRRAWWDVSCAMADSGAYRENV